MLIATTKITPLNGYRRSSELIDTFALLP